MAETFQVQIVVRQHPSVITAGYTPVFHGHTTQAACTIEPSSEIPELGSFAIRDVGQRVAAGRVLSVTAW